MGALSDMVAAFGPPEVEIQPERAAIPANVANLSSVAVGESQESQESQGVGPEIRTRLLALADFEGIAAAHVHRLHADDVAGCDGLSDDTLRAYLHALERGRNMDAGIVPIDWRAVAHCEGCGPIHWHRAERLKACPWCFRRKAGKAIPRPRGCCGDCAHYLPDPMNPSAGHGRCKIGKAARWPMALHRCDGFSDV